MTGGEKFLFFFSLRHGFAVLPLFAQGRLLCRCIQHIFDKIPYPVVGSFTKTWVTAPMSRERHTGRSLHLCPVGNGLCAIPILRRRVKHIFDKNTVAPCGVIYQNMGDSTHKFSVLDNGRAAHGDVKQGTKEFCVFLRFLCVFR